MLQTDPSNIYVHVHRSLAYIGQGKIPEALEGLQAYLDQVSLCMHFCGLRNQSQATGFPVHFVLER